MPHIYDLSGSILKLTVIGVRYTKVHNIYETLGLLDKLADGTIYQLFDAEKIAGPDHIYYAASNAEYAMRNGLNISNNLNVETLLYAACENQINKAIKLVGVSESTKSIAVAVISDDLENKLTETISSKLGQMDDSVLDFTPEKYEALKKTYGITETAIETVGSDRNAALTSLIAEKGALLSLRR